MRDDRRIVDDGCLGIPYISKLRRGKDKLESLDDTHDDNKEVLKEHQKMSKEEISKVMRHALQRYLVDLIRAVVRKHMPPASIQADIFLRCFGLNQIGFAASLSCPLSRSHLLPAVDSRAKQGS